MLGGGTRGFRLVPPNRFKMGIENIVRTVKKIHPQFVVIVDNGKFYYTYGKDSYIISYLFNYRFTNSKKSYYK